MGRVFAWLAAARQPQAVVEIGTAFGISGMYWLAGLEIAGSGMLYTFEPNVDWASFAEANLKSISTRFLLIRGTFEEKALDVLADVRPEIAFVDAIHTAAFVGAQYELLKKLMAPGGLILFDDINFSEDMRQCWSALAHAPEAAASAQLGSRVGILELLRG
ncbi:MAG TPA: class I SAM-dependent methyltransferase [Acetobacteraceae bacterium]|jgi:predicted O-methyltransferase YrrM